MWWIIPLAAGYALVGVFAVRYRRAHRRFVDAPVVPRPPGEELTLYELAFLALNKARVAEIVLASMLLDGRLTARDKVLTLVDPVPRDAVEADAVRAIGRGPRRRAWRRMDRLGAGPGIAAVGDRLAAQGLTASPTRYRAAGAAQAALFLVLLLATALGGLAIGLSVPEPGSVLIPIAATAALPFAGRRALGTAEHRYGWTTEAGRALLEAHDSRHPSWSPRNDPDPTEPGVLLARAARHGHFSGPLAPLKQAVTWPPSRFPSEPADDPPGLGGL